MFSVQSNYNNQKIDVEWLETNLTMDLTADDNLAVNVLSPVVLATDNMNGNNYDSSKIGMEYDLSGGASTQGISFKRIFNTSVP